MRVQQAASRRVGNLAQRKHPGLQVWNGVPSPGWQVLWHGPLNSVKAEGLASASCAIVLVAQIPKEVMLLECGVTLSVEEGACLQTIFLCG